MIASLARELDQAEANANDAIGLIQTEEGALTETHSMLQRMTTLATQAANGTYSTSEEGKTARDAIQKEVDELANEITRIADNTKYNGLSPLDGSSTVATSYSVKTIGGTAGAIINNTDGTSVQGATNTSYVIKTDGTESSVVAHYSNTDTTTAANDYVNELNSNKDGYTYSAVTAKPGSGNVVDSKGQAVNAFTTGSTYVLKTNDKGANYTVVKEYTADGATLANDKEAELTKAQSSTGKAITLQVGPTAGEQLTINQTDMTFSGLFGVNNTVNNASRGNSAAQRGGVNGEANVDASGNKVLDMSSVDAANTAITRIQTAINSVSSYRADLGAKQNRLEHTINNLKTTNENVTAAESRIRDTDMAKEIAAYTKNNILSQAAQSMLAQANQSGQGVLTLLRG
ncbi:flagellin [Lachnospiraceae bacterium YH-ros2228]